MPATDPQLFDDSSYRRGTPSTRNPQPQSPGIAPKVHPGQFAMFMTPREIRGKYQALDADREDIEDYRAGEPTGRAETTAGKPNHPIFTGLREELGNRRLYNSPESTHARAWQEQVAGATHVRRDDVHTEDDDELFSRKLNESQMPPTEYRELHSGASAGDPPGWETAQEDYERRYDSHGPQEPSGSKNNTSGWRSYDNAADEHYENVGLHHERMNDEWEAKHGDFGPSLYDRIAQEGIRNPVHLSYDQMGFLGKQSVVGGHHRLAAQEDINPDTYIPVRHWSSIREARGSGEYS